MKKLIIGLLFLVSSTSLLAQKLVLKRVCNSGNNNQLTWQFQASSCTLIGNAKLYAKESFSQAFYLINNAVNPISGNFTHNNANVPSVKDWYYFFEYASICGSDTFTFHTDTLQIDNTKPDSTILDSVSVDPINNVVQLGWTSNKTADFFAYYLYNYDRADPRLIENFKDTFFIDLNPVNPKSKSLSYDITSADSCNNRKEYGAYQHKTIHLIGKIDTCINAITLSWTPYVGWPVGEYQIFRSTNGSTFNWIASTAGSVLKFEETINLPGANISYFVRARKEKDLKVSSSSNSSPALILGKSINPSNTIIKQITNDTDNKIQVEIARNPLADYLNIELLRVNTAGMVESVFNFNNNENEYIDNTANNKFRYDYYILSRNMCGVVSDSSPFSNNIVLNLNGNNNNIDLFWNRYFTWNTGVKNYTIYRSSGNNINEAINFTAIANAQTDTLISILKDNFAVNCFYVLATDNSNLLVSRSNVACYVKAGKVYYPNAIVPNGINKTFTFVGEGVDLQNSSIAIYNRWGQVEYAANSIEAGWDGKDNNRKEVNTGVYFFIAKIKVGLETIDINGSISVIR